MIINRSRKVRLYPSLEQTKQINRFVGACKSTWNHFLRMNMDRYEAEKKFYFYPEMTKMLPGLKKEYPWLSEVPSDSLIRVCKHLDQALKDSFKNNRSNKSAKEFPVFKKKSLYGAFYIKNN